MLVAFFVPFLIFIAFFLLFLASLSIPIIKTVSVLNLSLSLQAGLVRSGISGAVKFGLWGYCVSEINASVVGINQSRAGYCSKTRLGYDLDSQLLNLLGLDNLEEIFSRGLTFVLVLHPIACGLAFLALLFAFWLICRPARLASAMALVFSVLAAIIATIAFAVDIALTTVAKNKISSATDGNLKITYGAVPWMTLGAMLALWAATVGACCGIFVGGKHRRDTDKY
ncbi:hypothetical protein CTheo_105 [Ceratobasidium theobromae]|uniref:SUR7/pali family protein n=1 Tax=Ceratobasidium theobromae TaxID=1582974 RepID=A0A5N5QXR5_9AGAM|nr:hypothetical protein CTheo_105 [Ceratobasidium theobromae]